MSLKICIWMNIPSHYQSDFFAALNIRDDVDLVVRYFSAFSGDRKKEGWASKNHFKEYELCVENNASVLEKVETVPSWKERIHIVSSNFDPGLVDFFCTQKVKWCHWSEMPGVRLAELLGYRMSLYKLLSPLMLILKYKDSCRIKSHALGALGQGVLAKRAFNTMGIPKNRISELYYSPEPLMAMEPSSKVTMFSQGRKVFLTVSVLCKRKGIDVLLRSFAKLAKNDWCLVLCGYDKSNGEYDALVEKLGLQAQVLFLGAYPIQNIAEVYAASDVFVLASRFDGWGAVLNEAASLGIPMIGTDMCGASWHIIEDGMNGYRVKANSCQALTKAMQVYVEKPEMIKKHGEKAKEFFFKEFTPGKNAERLVLAINKFLGESADTRENLI